MIFSMTGFAALERDTGNGVLLIELRSVNHRYLELQMKLDESLRGFEPMARELITARLGRGKVECRMSLARRQDAGTKAQLDAAVLEQLAQASLAVHKHFPSSAPLSVADILRWPGVMLGNEAEDQLADTVRAGLEQALQELSQARAREGAKLRQVILERLADMEREVEAVKPLLPGQIKTYQEKLTARLREALGSVDESRIQQEIVLFAQRVDVDEELSRLGAHISEVKRILDADAAAGKRLDFLMQELNREANTLGSKSVSTEVTRSSMALKVLIEQMREQIQNIE